LDGYMGKECHSKSPRDGSNWKDCTDFSFKYKANPPTLVVHGKYIKEQNGKPFNDSKDPEGLVPVNVNVNLGLIDNFEPFCGEGIDEKVIAIHYPETEGHDGNIDTGLSPRGSMYHLVFLIDEYRGKSKVRCEKIFRALKHLAEHAPRQVWKKELF